MENRLFSDAESLGFGDFKGREIFDISKENVSKKEEGQVAEKSELDFLLKKSYECPVCGNNFKALVVKATKPQLLGTDPDMRPVHKYMDVIKYDCVACEKCGYATLSKYFDRISDSQIRIVRTEVSAKFKGLKPTGDIYTYEEAIKRFQLALVNAVFKKTKNSERAYICLKLAWLYRGKRLALKNITEEQKKILTESEMQYIKKAREGFSGARMKERFPIEGMDEYTFDFLLAQLSIECEDFDEAKKLISGILVSRSAPSRVRERAKEVRDFLNEKQKKQEK